MNELPDGYDGDDPFWLDQYERDQEWANLQKENRSMSGADEGYKVVLTYNGVEQEIVGDVYWDWDDDDETQRRISFFARHPE